MKTIYLIALFFTLLSSAGAKMASLARITNIKEVIIEEGKITIIGEGVYRSLMVTSESEKNSEAVIYGKPTATYTAKGDSVEFIIRPYTTQEGGKEIMIFKDLWAENLKIAKDLEAGGEIELALQGDKVSFTQGQITQVEGPGVLKPMEGKQIIEP